MSHHPNHPQHHQHKKKPAQVHKDWRTWVVIILMLAGMAVYVLSDDESLGPEGRPQEAMPSADAE